MKKLVFGLLVLLFVGVIGSVILTKGDGGSPFKTVPLHEKQIIDNKEIRNLDIHFSSSDVQVLPSEDDNIILEVKGKVTERQKDKFKLDVEENGENLEVKFERLNLYFQMGVWIVDPTVMVYLPEKVYDTVNVHTSSGDIDTKGLNARQIALSVSSGVITAEDMEAEHSLLQTSSRDIYVTNVIGDITASTSTGDIMIQNDEASGNIMADVSTGDVTVEYGESPTSLLVNYQSSVGLGNVELDGVNYEEKSNSKMIGMIGSGEYELNVDIVSGNFTLR
ncbi:DUF4097 family beta strand repeat-containing protein [Jeotgalibacillus marinus]|uniref:DUF4097 family beta strand repeat-containing protein n=1 Tax=Jeotgalibacillus marinus TaxID=86667 RepID=A0ABV3Q6W4_9BACL